MIEWEKELDLVKDFLRSSKLTGIAEISAATGVDSERIINFIKEGRLVLTTPISGVEFKCERCGNLILSGRFCSECAKNLSQELRDNISFESKSGSGMLSRDTIKKKHGSED
ncbi:MAG TPA: MerR family transcriptional regulator [Actinobacteria bacterium]|nr:MerR family transcriptional regulator [Actinomycetota bacterium]